MSKPNSRINDQDQWVSCQGGELQSLGDSLRKAERTRIAGQVVQRSLIAASAVILLAFSINTLTVSSQPGAISCAECHDRFAAYEQHLTQASLMSEPEAKEMATHLSACDSCRGYFEADYPGLIASAGASVAATFYLLGFYSLREK